MHVTCIGTKILEDPICLLNISNNNMINKENHKFL